MSTKHKQGGILGRLRVKNVRARLPESEWNFDKNRVPDDELVACCFYEYARESPSIVAALEKPNEIPPVRWVKGPGGGSVRVKPSLSETFNVRLRNQLQEFAPFVTAAYATGKRTFAEPWQAKEQAERRKVCEMPGVSSVAGATIGSRFRLMPFVRATCLNKDGLLEKGRECPEVDVANGLERLLVEIDWGEFTNKQIVESFKRWVRWNRPPELPEPSERGHDVGDWRAMLERLGIMRLMHRHSFDEIKEITNAALPVKSAAQDKFSIKAVCKKERQKALRDFQGLFPLLLPADEKPRRWQTKPGCGW